MADYLVESATTLERHLTRNGVQPWRVPVLVRTRGVIVLRDKAAVPISAADMRLKDGDWVRVVDPPTQATLNALAAAATADARDYAFVPGATPFDIRMASVLAARPRTMRITTIDALSAFIRSLGRGDATAPIRHLVPASHANNEGQLFMRLDFLDAREISYEDLDDAVKRKTLVIDPAWLMPRPKDAAGAEIPALCLIRGCRIGTAPAYLKRLREALGGAVPVVAPKHFHVAAGFSRPAGFLEYMETNWGVSRPTRLPDRPAVIAAFQAGGFALIDGSPVPSKAWGAFLPRNPHAGYKQTVKATVVNPIIGRRQDFPGEFRFRIRRLRATEQSFGLKADPRTDAARKAAVMTELEKAHPQYLSSHPYPAYARLGYSSMQEFMDGFDWTFRYDRASETLFFNASRAEYTVLQPIADPANGKVFLNFYPTGRAGKVIELLQYTDRRFFEQA
jgi:hypothetical protein